jgi:hypothetical protein
MFLLYYYKPDNKNKNTKLNERDKSFDENNLFLSESSIEEKKYEIDANSHRSFINHFTFSKKKTLKSLILKKTKAN